MSSNQTTNYGLHQWQPGDTFLRSEINENFAALDGAVTRVVTGSYTGNGQSSQFVDLGRTPRMVIVSYGGVLESGNTDYGGVIYPEQGSRGAVITEGGFTALYSSSNYSVAGNRSGSTYRYTAFF